MNTRSTQTLTRQELPVVNPDPRTGLTAQQVRQRLQGGWSNQTGNGAVRTDRQIILENCLTFFNLIFLILAVLLILAGSSVIKLSFLYGRIADPGRLYHY